MALFTVDESKCKKDGICAAVCPIGAIIRFNGKEHVPTAIAETEFLCLNCGHCVAVCPHGALSHEHLTADDCLPFDKDMQLNPDQTEHFLRSRRSIRRYRKKAVEHEKIEEIIRLAAYAPSGHNTQPVHWQVVSGRDKIKELTAFAIEWMEKMLEEQPDLGKMLFFDELVRLWHEGTDMICRDAPVLILSNGFVDDTFSENACKIATTYLDLAIPSFGLGAQWNGYFQMAVAGYQPLQEALGFPENFTNYAAMLVGYPKYRFHRMPTRNEPRITWVE